METVTRTFDLLDRYKKYFPKEDVLAAKSANGDWNKYSIDTYLQQVNLFSYGLLALNLKKGDKIAIISNNRPHWNFADMGMSQLGVISVPIYPTISTEDYDYILRHAKPKMVLISSEMLFRKLDPVIQKIHAISYCYTFDEVEGASHWSDITKLGEDNASHFRDELTTIKQDIRPEDILTLLYTSGTTGPPKGVLLTHQNLVSNFVSTAKVHHLNERHRALSFLPLSHIYERMLNYHYQYKGISIYYAENMGTIANDLREVQPDLFATVPRLLEKMYDKILSKGQKLPNLQRKIFMWAVDVGLQFDKDHQSWLYRLKLKIANILVFKKWREALGGNVKLVVSGGAALQSRLEKVFWAAGVKVLQGYGLTETSPVIAVDNLATNEVKLGTVGPVIEGLEVKISEAGEILCRGPSVMKGYYKAPKQTAEVLDKEGWFYTGDVGSFVDQKYLKITDRKKEIFKLSSGKYIAPQILENKFKESIYIEHMMVVGENQKYAGAIISPNFQELHNWAYERGIEFRDNEELINKPQVQELYKHEIASYNKTVGQAEHIRKFRLVCDEWSPDTGELSPTLKIKRHVLMHKYGWLIDRMFEQTKDKEQKNGMFGVLKKGVRKGLRTGNKLTRSFIDTIYRR